MNIPEKILNCKEKFKNREKDIFISILIILTGFLGFGIGRLSKIFENKTPVKIQNSGSLINTANEFQNLKNNNEKNNALKEKMPFKTSGQNDKIYVASKKGTKYYFAWCDGVKRIKEENKIWFNTKEEAEKRGLAPAKNCKGI